MNPREFQQLALKLAAGASSAEIRTAISRAYYAAYNVGIEILREMEFKIIEGPSGHGDVSNRLSNSGDQEIIKAGSTLGTLHSMRIHADYHLNMTNVENQKTAQALVEQANRTIKVLDECRSEPKKTTVCKAIQDYDRKISGATP